METLSKEWQQEAEKLGKNMFGSDFLFENSGITPRKMQIYQRVKGFEQGATAYKQAVEAKIKGKIENLEAMADKFKTPINHSVVYRTYKDLLTELQTLTPTSND